MSFDQLIWIATLALAGIAVLQVVYLFWLRYAPTGERAQRQPSAPIMPTAPGGGFNTHYGGAPAAPRVAGGKLIVTGGLAGGGEMNIPSANCVVGRFYNPEQNVLIALDDKSISRRHAQFNADDSTGAYYLTDLHSTYGTRIRKENQMMPLAPDQRERLYNEDVVQFGNNVTVRFILPGDTRASATRL
jgi:hypothetical protein